MPAPGPVAYHVQAGRFTSDVISAGRDQLSPSSPLRATKTRRVSWLVPSTIAFSSSLPRFQLMRSQTVRVCPSTTAHGLPHVFPGSSQTMRGSPQERPPSVERRSRRATSPLSRREVRRPSQNASRVPSVVTTREGMRKV